jgi:small-conductance mechanosensitive channel
VCMVALLLAAALVGMTVLALLLAGALVAAVVAVAMLNLGLVALGARLRRLTEARARRVERWRPSAFRLPPELPLESEDTPHVRIHRL